MFFNDSDPLCDVSTSLLLMSKPIAKHYQLGILWNNQFTNQARKVLIHSVIYYI